jgi:hypothetical protein
MLISRRWRRLAGAVPVAAWLAGAGLVATWLAAGCSLIAPRFERPEISVADIQMVGGNLLQQNFLVKLNIENPNDRTVPVTSLHAEIDVAGERLASGVSNRPFVVPARGSTQFEMTVTANLALALLKLSQAHDPGRSSQGGAAPGGSGPGRSVDYDMTGIAVIDLPFLRELPFHQHGSFPLGAR